MQQESQNTRIPPEEMAKMIEILKSKGCWKEDDEEEVDLAENVNEGE
ncbi:hypothetical protein [Pseudomonas sp. HY7a-MNA-CIBAN-0227]